MEPYVITVTLNPALDKTVTVDALQRAGLNRVKSVRMDPGGKGVNVAKVLHGFGVKVKASGLIAGTQGQMLLHFLKDLGIDYGFHGIPGETRTNLKVYEEASHTITEINEPGFTVSEEDLSCFKEILSGQLEKAACLVLSGSLPPGVPEDIYGQLVALAKAKGVKTILDADGKALENGIKAIPYAIKPNVYELEQLTGRKMSTDKDIRQAAGILTDRGIDTVMVSMGADGALLVNRTDSYRVRTCPITPKSTVGAGDSMVAAFVYTLLQGYAPEETARLVTAAGTVTASKPGTEVCALSEVLEWLGRIQVEKQ